MSSTRALTAINTRRLSPILVSSSTIRTRQSSRNSGRTTPSASRTRCVRSAASRDDFRHPGSIGRGLTMTLRADHVAGGFFIGLGALVFALSGNLPTGSLSMPGSGFLPKILAGLSILFGIALILRARESRPFRELQWSDGKHAALVVTIT